MEELNEPHDLRCQEYVAQFFGFNPDAFIDSLTGKATDICRANLKEAERHILSCFEGKVSPEELSAAFERLEERYVESTEKVFLNLGLYVKKNLLSIPSYVYLPEDQERRTLDLAVDAADLKAAQNKLDSLCDRLALARLKQAILQEKVNRLQEVQKRQAKLLREARNFRDAKRMANTVNAEVARVAQEKSELNDHLAQKD